MQTNNPNRSSRVLSTIWAYLALTFLAFLRLVASCGQYAFSMPKFMKYVTNEDDSPYEPIVTISAISLAAIMNLTIYIPAMYLHMHKKANHNQPPRTPLRWQYRMLQFFLYRVLGYASILSSGFGAYLNSKSLIERVLNVDEEHVYQEPWHIYALEGAALIFAIGNMYTNISRRLKSYEKYTNEFTSCLQAGTLPKDRYVLYTIGVTFAGIASSPFQGYFSGSHAITRIHGFNPSENFKHWFGIYSAITSTNFQLFTLIPGAYAILKKNNEQIQVTHPHKLDRPISIATKAFGVGDSITTGMTTFIAIVTTSNDAFDVNPKDPGLVTVAMISAGSTTLSQYYFGVLVTSYEVRKDYYLQRDQRHARVYTQIPSVADIEAGPSEISTSLLDDDVETIVRPTEPLAITGTAGFGIFDRPLARSFDSSSSLSTTVGASITGDASSKLRSLARSY